MLLAKAYYMLNGHVNIYIYTHTYFGDEDFPNFF